jgi:HdeA/HdeB family protein
MRIHGRTVMKLIPTTAYALALSVSLSAAQTLSTTGADNATTPPPTAAPSDPIAPGGHWNVADARCPSLLRESDDDRAAIGMFYYGYLSAKLSLNTIDTSRIENDLRHVFETCHQHPDMTIVAAFRTLRQKNR